MSKSIVYTDIGRRCKYKKVNRVNECSNDENKELYKKVLDIAWWSGGIAAP